MESIRSTWPLRRDLNRSGELHAAQRGVKKLSIGANPEYNFADNFAVNFGDKVGDSIGDLAPE
jgi:hypothetical protein